MTTVNRDVWSAWPRQKKARWLRWLTRRGFAFDDVQTMSVEGPRVTLHLLHRMTDGSWHLRNHCHGESTFVAKDRWGREKWDRCVGCGERASIHEVCTFDRHVFSPLHPVA